MKKGIFVLGMMVLLASCSSMMSETKKGSGNVTKETKTTESFDAIMVSNALNVFITMGDKESIEVEADDNIQEHIKTEVKNGTLRIYIENGINIKNTKADIYVTAVNLERIDASTAADVIVENTIKSKSFKCNVSSSADVNLKLEAYNLNAQASSSGEIKISGKATDANLNVSSAGDIKADDFEVDNCDAKASSGGEINLFATESLTADASSGSNISYKGSPKKLKTNSSSGGKIKQN